MCHLCRHYCSHWSLPDTEPVESLEPVRVLERVLERVPRPREPVLEPLSAGVLPAGLLEPVRPEPGLTLLCQSL